jgi:large subunit ribosomal protein L1
LTLVPENALVEAIKGALSPEHNPKRNFLQSVEMIVTFKGIDMKKGELKLRETVVLPKAPSKLMKVLVVPTLQQMEYAKKAEPNVLLSKEELQKLQGQKRAIKKLASQNDWFLIAPESMALAGRILGPALGPRNKFPSPLPNTPDITEYVLRFKRSVAVKTKDQPHVQVFVGTEDMKPEDLLENAKAVLTTIESKVKSPSNVGAVYFKTTMGKPVKVKL